MGSGVSLVFNPVQTARVPQRVTHSDPVVPEWFSRSVFRCISVCKHPGAWSQAVKVFCDLANKLSSLAARKMSSPQCRNDSNGSVFVMRGVMEATGPRKQTDRLVALLLLLPLLLLLQKAAITEAITAAATQTVRWNPAERSPHLASHHIMSLPSDLLISFRFEVPGAHRRLWLQGSRSTASPCWCSHQMLARWTSARAGKEEIEDDENNKTVLHLREIRVKNISCIYTVRFLKTYTLFC